jgi:hypothetical protein
MIDLNLTDPTKRTHTYHAQAGVLHARLQLPISQEIKPQAFTKLSERGGYLSQHAHNYQLEGIVSYRAAYTQVAGNKELKDGHGFVTVATSVIEHLNILDVVTADRVVAQVSTEHPLTDGHYVPRISFLGTRFENLRIAGHRVHFTINHNVFGEADGKSSCTDKLRNWITEHAEKAKGQEPFEDEDLDRDFNEDPCPKEDPDVDPDRKPESTEGSLGSGVELEEKNGSYPGECFNHVIKVPNFGTVHLANLRLKHEDFQKGTGIPKRTTVDLSMLKVKMGCLAAGTMAIGNTRTNGGTRP